MKKFFTLLTLILGFLTLVPHIVMATSRVQSELELSENMKRLKPVLCFLKHKLNLPREYEGHNLKLIATASDVKDKLKPNREMYTGGDYLIEYDSDDVVKIVVSNVFDCKTEQLRIYVGLGNGGGKGRIEYIVNIIDVPLGSTLKYMPETKEIQVISPSEEVYKEKIERYKNTSEIIKFELERYGGSLEYIKEQRIKKIIAGIAGVVFGLVLVAIIALVVFLVKKILKKFKKRV